MKDNQLDLSFDRFRKHGDPASLALVFDGTAHDLASLAVHLVRDANEAEDLVQQTFLTAIEKRDQYDLERPLLPWLVGILVLHAHNARRRRSRTKDAVVPELSGGPDPVGSVQATELASLVRGALDKLSANYRNVLEPYLLHNERAVDIARTSGSSAGTVRMQLRRGLDELRRVLPAGLSLGAALVVSDVSLAATRDLVLKQAARTAAEGATLSGSALASKPLLGVLATVNKFVLAGVVFALVSVLVLTAQESTVQEHDSLAAGRTNKSEHVNDSHATGTVDTSLGSVSARSSRVEATPPQSRPNIPDSDLAGATGRLVDEDGEPTAGLRVQLLELKLEALDTNLPPNFDADPDALATAASWNPLIAETVADELGQFSFSGADPNGLHALRIDPGGPAERIQLVDVDLQAGDHVQLGTIALRPGRTVSGQVTDADKTPLSGVRVSVCPFPPGFGIPSSLRPNSSLIYLYDENQGAAVQCSTWFATFGKVLGSPSTTTDNEGHFTLQGVSHEVLMLYMEHDQYGSTPIELRAADELGTLRFEAHSQFSGRIVDSTGQAVADAQVLFGLRTPGVEIDHSVTIANGEVRSDAEGAFTFASSGSPIVLVREHRNSKWTTRTEFRSGQTITLDAVLTGAITLKDETNKPVLGAQFHFAPENRHMKSRAMLGMPDSPAEVRELGDGRYQVEGLVSGMYGVLVLADGFALLERRLTVASDTPTFELQMQSSLPREIHVVDAQSQQPIAGARVSVRFGVATQDTRSSDFTNLNGRVVIAKVPTASTRSLSLFVTRPGYAPVLQDLDPGAAGLIEVELSTGNSAVFNVTVNDQAAPKPLSIELKPSKSSSLKNVLPFPKLQVCGGSEFGQTASFHDLAAGEWDYEITTRRYGVELKSLLGINQRYSTLAKGKLTVRKGERTSINVELDPELFPDRPADLFTSALEGTILVAGGTAARLQVALARGDSPQLHRQWMDVPADGRYFFDGLAAGDYTLLVASRAQPTVAPEIILSPEVTLQLGVVTREDVQLVENRFELALVDEFGLPVDDGTVVAYAIDGRSMRATSGERVAAGVQALTIWSGGNYLLEAKSPTAGTASMKVIITSSISQRLGLKLFRGLNCAGQIRLAGSAYSGMATVHVYNREDPAGEHHQASQHVNFEDGLAQLNLLGLTEGEYQASVFAIEGGTYDVRFTLAPNGSDSLSLFAVRDTARIGSGPSSRPTPVRETAAELKAVPITATRD